MGLTLTDEYGQEVTLATTDNGDGTVTLIASTESVDSNVLIVSNEYGVDTRLALTTLPDGRKAILVDLVGAGSGGGTGTDGKSAYELAIENGFVGTVIEWLASLVGPQGPSGSMEDPGDLVNAFNANLV